MLYEVITVPFGFVTDLFGFERNNYDRFGHFSVGFYAYAVAEYLLMKRRVNTRALLYLFPLFSIFSVAAIYEIFEWLYAVTADPTAGIARITSYNVCYTKLLRSTTSGATPAAWRRSG